MKYALAREFFDLQQDFPDPGPPAGKLVLDGASHHHPDELPVVGCGRHLADHLPVPQDRHPVSDLGNLFEVMRDEDHADLFLFEASNYLEETLDFLPGERGGRLVHDQDPGVQTQRLRYLDHLPLRDAQSRDRVIRANAHLYPLQEPRASSLIWLRSTIPNRLGWRPRKMFSATVSCGTRLNSW